MLNIQELENKAVLKEGAEKEKAYQYLKSLELPQIVTYKQIHDMFGSVGEPFSQEFKKFFKKYKEEFLYNPEYYSDFGKIQKNFNNIINSQELREKYAKGKVQLQDIKKYLENVRFANQKERRRRIS